MENCPSGKGMSCGEACGENPRPGRLLFRCKGTSKERLMRLEVLRRIEPRIVPIAEVGWERHASARDRAINDGRPRPD